MKKILLVMGVMLLASCKTTYETFTYVEVRGNELVIDTVEIDSRYAHDMEAIRRQAGLSTDKWINGGMIRLDKDSHLKINKEQGRYPK